MSARARVHAHRKTRAVCCLYGSVAGFMAGATAMVALAETPFYGAGLVLLAALTLGGAVRGARVAVVEVSDGLLVRNPFRTYRVRWSNAVALGEAQPWWFKGLKCPALRTRGGRDVAMFGMVAWDRLVNSEASGFSEDFAQVVARWKAQHGLREPASGVS